MPARVPLRVEVRDVLSLHRGGRHDEALRRALDLAAAQGNRCALVMNLAGNLLLEARLRTLGPSPDLGSQHLRDAARWYKVAAAEAPNCVETAAAYVAALLDLRMYSEAEVELVRGMSIASPDDPLLHNVAVDGLNCSREDRIRIAGEKLRVAGEELRSQFQRISANKEDDDIAWVLTLIETSGVDSTVAAAAEIAKRFPFSARAQLLPVYVEVEMVRHLSRDSKSKREILGRAVKSIRVVANTFHSSLVIAIYHAKLLVVVGEYEAAERECDRALHIDEPVDPKVHDIPLGSSSGEDYSARVLAAKDEINGLLKILTTQRQWAMLTKDEQDNLLCVKVETLINHYRSSNQAAADTIFDAMFQFKRHNSWSLWICPFPDLDCNGCWSPKVQDLIQHFLAMHFQVFTKKLEPVVDRKLSFPENASDVPSPFDVLSLCQDSEQRDLFCFTELGDMLHYVLLLSSGAEPSSVQAIRTKKCREAAAILKSIEKKLKTFPAHKSGTKVHKALDSLQMLWMKLLDASHSDYREIILPLMSSFKWGEIKKCFEEDKDPSCRRYHMDISDAVFFDCLGICDGNLSLEHGSKPSYENKDHQNGAEEQLEDFKEIQAGELQELPQEILMDIFSLLEIPDLVRAGSVCSSWNSAYTSLRSIGQYKQPQTMYLFYTSESDGENVACLYSLAEEDLQINTPGATHPQALSDWVLTGVADYG